VRVALLESFLLAGLTPVIAPMAPGAGESDGPPFNVNADDAAAAIAGGLHAAELLLVSDVPGVRVDGALRSTLEVGEIETLIELGVAANGMAAKLRAATAALRDGARAVRIGDARLLEDPRAGTRIVAPAVQPA
jgi:acetylglutamate kinase